jgi:lipopolysaccharide biosynthesis glycosyltransferase
MGYAAPMLVSARSLVQNAKRQNFDVMLFAVDFPNDRLAAYTALAAQYGMLVVPLDSRTFLAETSAKFISDARLDHINAVCLARLATGPHIPAAYARVLHVDGDTYGVGDISDLAAYPVKSGIIMAATDGVNFYKHDNGPCAADSRGYLAGLGLALDETYYTSGVLDTDRATWMALGPEVLRFYTERTDICRYHDESALNVVARKQLRPMSLKWNFMAEMRMWGMDEAIGPRLYHFAGPEKPWRGEIAPWRDFAQVFTDAMGEPEIRSFAPPRASAAAARKMNRYMLVERLKRATLYRGRRARARRALIDSEKQALI